MILLAAAGTSAVNEDPGVEWVGDTLFSDARPSGVALASFSVNSDGSVSGSGSGGQSADWRLPNQTGIGAKYDVMFTLISGDAPSSATLGVWLNLSTSRSVTNSTSTSRSSNILVEIRNSISGIVRLTQNVLVTADVAA